MGTQKKMVAIYVRLSNEDTRAGESVSIENQKLLLSKHAKEQGWTIHEIYCDDGFSGTNQNRPALQRMLADAQQGCFNTVLIKDLSRLGRNYLEVGQLAEVTLPQYGCELVSLNEQIDDMMVFRNWFNEQHSKQTSQKVKAVKKVCAESGKFLGTYAPYGYKKDPENKHHLVIDDVVAPTVRQIFTYRAQGLGFRAIANTLNEQGVLPPRDYYYQQKNKENPLPVNHLWNENTLKVIMRNEVYIGHVVQGKVGTASYKSREVVNKPKEEWIRAENMHDPLIDLELWERVQAMDAKRYKPRKRKDGTRSIFTGLLYCADCGSRLHNRKEREKRKDGSEYHRSYFICGNYARSGKSACTIHGINEKVLHSIVLEDIQKYARMVAWDEEKIVAAIISRQDSQDDSYRFSYQQEIKTHRDRLGKLEQIVAQLYEDRVTGTVPEKVFCSLMEKYETERVDRANALAELETRLAELRRDADNAENWARSIRPCLEMETLDTETLLRLVDKIVVGNTEVIDGQRVCDVTVSYNHVGNLGWLEVAQGGYMPTDEVVAYGQAV